jgi:hypothetical protein
MHVISEHRSKRILDGLSTVDDVPTIFTQRIDVRVVSHERIPNADIHCEDGIP